MLEIKLRQRSWCLADGRPGQLAACAPARAAREYRGQARRGLGPRRTGRVDAGGVGICLMAYEQARVCLTRALIVLPLRAVAPEGLFLLLLPVCFDLWLCWSFKSDLLCSAKGASRDHLAPVDCGPAL